MARPKGSGVLKSIDPQKHDSVAMRRMLHAGGEPVKDDAANLLIHWRNLIAQRGYCARRLAKGEGDKWTRKRRKQLNAEIDDTWRQLGEHLIKNSDAADWNSSKLSEKLDLLSKAARPAIFDWQEETVRLLGLGLPLPAGKTWSHSMDVQRPSANQLLKELRARGLKVHVIDDTAKRMVRRFVRDTLRIELRSEQGNRTDLRGKTPRGW